MPPLSDSRTAWRLVALLWVAFLINYVDRQIVFSMFPVLRSELHFSETLLGVIGSLFLWVYSSSMLLTGRLADVIRRDRIVVGSLVLWSVATLGTGLSRTATEFLFWRALVGVTEALYVPAAFGLIANFHSGRTRSRALAIHGTAQFTGIVAGGWAGGWMADHHLWRYGFAALALIGVLYAVFLARAFRSFPAMPAVERSPESSSLEILTSRCYLALTASFVAFNGLLWMFYAWLPDWIRDHHSLTMAQSGFAATFFTQASTAVGVLIGGFLGDRLAARVAAGRIYVAAAGLALSAPFAWLTFATTSLAVARASSALFGLLSGLLIANLFASAYDVISERNYGAGAGVLNFCGGLSAGTAVFLAGAWKQTVGIPALVAGISLTAFCLAFVLIVVGTLRFEPEHGRARAHAGRIA